MGKSQTRGDNLSPVERHVVNEYMKHMAQLNSLSEENKAHIGEYMQKMTNAFHPPDNASHPPSLNPHWQPRAVAVPQAAPQQYQSTPGGGPARCTTFQNQREGQPSNCTKPIIYEVKRI